MSEKDKETKVIVPKSDLRTLTRVTESHTKKSGANPQPQTDKPVSFAPPGQGKPTGDSAAPSSDNSTPTPSATDQQGSDAG